MKKIFSLLIVLPIIFSVIACGSDSNGLVEDQYSKIPDDAKNFIDVTLGKKPLYARLAYTEEGKNPTKDFVLTVDFSKFTTADLSVYDPTLASISAMLALDMYYGSTYLEVKDPIDGKYKNDKTPNSFLKYMGGKDPRYFDVAELETFTHDINDVSTLTMAHMDFTVNGEKQQLFITNVKGSSYKKEWYSNFDMGQKDDSLYTDDVKAEHPDWTTYENFKGFDVTKNRAQKYVKKYVDAYKDDTAKQTYAFFGHSRGGVIASLLAKDFVDSNLRTVNYSVCAPLYTQSSDIVKYKTLFVDSLDSDICGNFPPTSLGFKAFGTRNVRHIDEDAYADKFEEFFHKEYVSMEIENILNFATSYLKDRKSAYNYFPEIDEDNEKFVFDTEDEAKEEYKNLQSSIKPNTNISKYVKVNAPIKEDNEWVVAYNVTPYYPLALVLDILVLLDSGQGDEIASYIFDSLKFGGRFIDALLDNFDIFIGLSVDGFKQAHDPGTMLFYLNQILPN